MIGFRRVFGESMAPTLRHGQKIVVIRADDYAVGDIVVAWHENKELIKRVVRVQNGSYWLEGDNLANSTDSRHFGWIDKSDILGVMKIQFPTAVDPPKLRVKRGQLFGWIAALIMVLFVLIHLFRVDTFVPELRAVLINSTLTFWVASLIIIMEVFALPFLMRMKLSPAAHYVSGAFAVVVPLFWTLVSIWTYGAGVSTAQLGEFVSLPSSAVLIIANLVWLLFSFYTIWALGYDHRPHEKQTFITRFFSRLSK